MSYLTMIIRCSSSSRLTRTSTSKNGRRQGRKGLWKGKGQGRVEVCSRRPPVPRGQDPPSPEEQDHLARACRRHRRRVQRCHPRVPHCWGMLHLKAIENNCQVWILSNVVHLSLYKNYDFVTSYVFVLSRFRFSSWPAMRPRISRWSVSRRATCSSPSVVTRSWTRSSRRPLPEVELSRISTRASSARRERDRRSRSNATVPSPPQHLTRVLLN